MRQLLPEVVGDVDPAAVHGGLTRRPPDGRPYVLFDMISSFDGATAVDGVSGALGGEGDRQMFRAIRTVPDVILVAARTANAEAYRSPQVDEAARAARVARGQTPEPRLAVVTGELSVDLRLPMFTDPGAQPPLVITSQTAPADRRAEVEAVAEVLVVGDAMVDLAGAMARLRDRDVETVLCEGGPSLNGGMVGLDLCDEWNLSLSPALAGGGSHRVVNTAPPALRAFDLTHVHELDGMLFLRYVRPA